MYSVKIEQRLGCWIEETTEKLDISKAGELLSTRKQKKYTYALRDEEQAKLVRHVWHCPHCGERTPAYAEYFQEVVDEAFDRMAREAGLTREERSDVARRVRMEAIMKSPERIAKVCAHIANHFLTKIDPNGFKGQVVCYDREC